MGLLTREERRELLDLLCEISIFDDKSARDDLLGDLPDDLRDSIESSGATRRHLTNIVRTVEESAWAPLDDGSWPIIRIVDNALYEIRSTRFASNLQQMLDKLKAREASLIDESEGIPVSPQPRARSVDSEELQLTTKSPPPEGEIITENTSLLSLPRASEEQACAYIIRRGSIYTPQDIKVIVGHYWRNGLLVGLDPLLALAQCIHETSNKDEVTSMWRPLSSWWAERPRRNPAGLGVTGKTQATEPKESRGWSLDTREEPPIWREGLSFATWDLSVQAHIGRLLAYAIPTGAETPVQRVLIDIALAQRPLPGALRGTAPTLKFLGAKHNPSGKGWASPGAEYGTRIASIAEEIRVAEGISKIQSIDPQRTGTSLNVADRVSIIPEGSNNRPGIKLKEGKPTFITIHETNNSAVGANADMHRKFVHMGGGPGQISFHYVVDDIESIQLLPDDEVAWHAGDGRNGPGNTRSVAVQICVNKDGNFEKALRNAIKVVVRLMAKYDIQLDNVVQHNHWNGKDCPHKLRSFGWQMVIDQIDYLSRNP